MPTDHQRQHRPFRTYRRAFRRISAITAALVLAGGLAACGGDDSPSASTDGAAGPEKTNLNVGTLPVPDAVPLFVAIQKGFFKQEGLNVKTTIIQAGPSSLGPLRGGQMDFALNNYVGGLSMAEGGVPWRWVADSYEGAKGAFVVMSAPGSAIKNPADLKNKTIAVPSVGGIGEVSTVASLKAYGVSKSDLKFVPYQIPLMAAGLKSKKFDAAWLTEPFISGMQQQGFQSVLDTMDPSGPTSKMPVAGWSTLADYTTKYPKTVAAFQRAMAKAQALAATDRNLVSQTLPTYVRGVTPDTARLVTLGSFPTGLNPLRIKRLVDMMSQYGYIKEPAKLDVNKLIIPGPPAS